MPRTPARRSTVPAAPSGRRTKPAKPARAATGARRDDERFMGLALRLGRRGLGRTSPNPPVGAVVVAGGTAVVGRGYHRKAGTAHAEVDALRGAGERARGATLYVTLEPCAHHGRTPPCVDAVLAAGVRRVVIGSRDPNPHVHGDGAARLRAAGLEVVTGVRAAECDELIAAFRKHVTTGLPLVILKLASSLDGRIATASGDSRWISGADSRRFVHRLRDRCDAVLVGAATVRRDDPQLTCRLRGGRDPLRVILDGRASLPLQSRVLATARRTPTLVVTGRDVTAARVERLEAAGARVLRLPARGGRVSLRALFRALGRSGVTSVLVEGGAAVATAALKAGVVDQLLIFYAPKLVGGDGRPLLDGLGVRQMRRALAVGPLRVRRFAADLLVATQVRR